MTKMYKSPTYDECLASVSQQKAKISGLEIKVINLQKEEYYCYAELPLKKPITQFRFIDGWWANQGIGCMLYNLSYGEPWAKDQENGARIAVRNETISVYSHPKYFGYAIEIVKSLTSS